MTVLEQIGLIFGVVVSGAAVFGVISKFLEWIFRNKFDTLFGKDIKDIKKNIQDIGIDVKNFKKDMKSELGVVNDSIARMGRVNRHSNMLMDSLVDGITLSLKMHKDNGKDINGSRDKIIKAKTKWDDTKEEELYGRFKKGS